MKKLYQKTFEQALAQTYAPPEQVEAQRSALASRCSKPKSEVTAMTTKPIRPIRILVTAAAVAAQPVGQDEHALRAVRGPPEAVLVVFPPALVGIGIDGKFHRVTPAPDRWCLPPRPDRSSSWGPA